MKQNTTNLSMIQGNEIVKKEEKQAVVKPLEQINVQVNFLLSINVTLNVGNGNKSRNYEEETKENESHCPESSANQKRRRLDEPFENQSCTKRVRIDMNASYRSATSDYLAVHTFMAHASTSAYRGPAAKCPSSPKLKSPKRSEQNNVTDIQKPIFKVPKVPPLKKSIVQKQRPQDHDHSPKEQQKPAYLRDLVKKQEKARRIDPKLLAAWNQPRMEQCSQTLKRFTSEFENPKVIAPLQSMNRNAKSHPVKHMARYPGRNDHHATQQERGPTIAKLKACPRSLESLFRPAATPIVPDKPKEQDRETSTGRDSESDDSDTESLPDTDSGSDTDLSDIDWGSDSDDDF